MSDFPRINSFVMPANAIVNEPDDDNRVTVWFATEEDARGFYEFAVKTTISAKPLSQSPPHPS